MKWLNGSNLQLAEFQYNHKISLLVQAFYQKDLVQLQKHHYYNNCSHIISLCDRRNPKAKNPCQYLRTTNEMLECYPYLSQEEAFEYVVTNTNKIADMIEEIKPVHDKLFTPKIEGADDNLK